MHQHHHFIVSRSTLCSFIIREQFKSAKPGFPLVVFFMIHSINIVSFVIGHTEYAPAADVIALADFDAARLF